MINVILLASGYGSRFGSNKLLYPIDGKPMYRYAVEAAKEFREQYKAEPVRLFCVTAYDEIRRGLQERDGFEVVMNRNQEKGISHSIKLGIQAAKTGSLLFMVCDQPWLTAAELLRLAEELAQSGRTIGCMAYGTETGNPVLFSEIYREELLRLHGDTGGKAVVKRHPEAVYLCRAANPKILADIDERKE